MADISLQQIVESIIFAADQPIPAASILNALNPEVVKSEQSTTDSEPAEEAESDKAPIVSAEELQEALDKLLTKYADERYPFEVRKVAKGYQFYTKNAYYPYVKQAGLLRNQKRLTRTAMETLAIVAYRQPVTKAEMEFIRGVNCDYAIQKLLEKKLVEITGRADTVGKPLLYSTSAFFMEYFGINGPDDLPKLKEFEEMMEDHMDEFMRHQTEPTPTAEAGNVEETSELPKESTNDQ